MTIHHESQDFTNDLNGNKLHRRAFKLVKKNHSGDKISFQKGKKNKTLQ